MYGAVYTTQINTYNAKSGVFLPTLHSLLGNLN